MRTIILVTIFTILVGCHRAEPAISATPGDEYAATSEQIGYLSEKANSGDNDALMFLIQHYTLYEPDNAERLRWLRLGAERGDPGHMNNLATELASIPSMEHCREALAWLDKAGKTTNVEFSGRVKRHRKEILENNCKQFDPHV